MQSPHTTAPLVQRFLLVLAVAKLPSRAGLDPQLVVSRWQIDFPLKGTMNGPWRRRRLLRGVARYGARAC